MDLGLRGRVVIVTGGARGIGAAIVEGFTKEGVNVVIADIELDIAKKLATDLTKNGIKALAVRTDVTNKTDVDNLVATALGEFGKIDILVNNAGVVRDILFVDIEEKDWDLVNNVNAKGVYLVTRAVVPHMIAAKYGKIVNISSRAGKEAQIGLSHYSASKFAVIGLTQALAKELAEYDINVNAICPGILRTFMWEKVILNARAKRQGLTREQVFESWINQIPLRRPQVPEDIANVVLFLSSQVSQNITGEAINVSGGLRMD